MATNSSSLTFGVRRREPELVSPAEQTPHEFKLLSDIDDQGSLRFQIQVIQFYRNNPVMREKDPVRVIREAIAQALVLYYPFAGRLRELPGRKLVVECTAEGIMFIEADADIRLQQFGDALKPPIPCLEELLYDVPGSGEILNCPLLLIQVTRLLCGGFIFAIRLNHTMCDAGGLIQFLTAISEIARGAKEPSIKPVWQRELLNARDPPQVSFSHHEYDEVINNQNTLLPSHESMIQKSFFFTHKFISIIRTHIPPHLRKCTSFELLTAYLWRCRTIALNLDPEEEVRTISIVNARNKYKHPLPKGYYGNVLAFPVALSKAGMVCNKPLGYALELVKKGKSYVTDEYMRSVADLMVIKGRPTLKMLGNFIVSDLTRLNFGEVDYGWGKAVYGGTTKAGGEDLPLSQYIAFKNNEGEDGILFPICLPKHTMENFTLEVERFIRKPALFLSAL